MNEPDRLYQLLPAVYRERDEAEGFPLRALLRLVSGQADLVHADIQQLWDNFFVETCQRWAIPYIGDLVSNNLLHDPQRMPTPDTAHALFPDLVGRDLRPPIAIRTRADVAKTIYYRRRKGTLPMLEELARDVTGWPAHAVEFFDLLGWTQCVRNHLRMHSLRTPDIRRVEPMDRLNGPFDAISHTVDVRPIGSLTGWYNIKNIGFFLWRLRSYPLEHVAARQAGKAWQYHFSPLGNPAPLFSRLRREGDEAGLATELHVPGPIRRAFFYDDLERYKTHAPRLDFTDLYGLGEDSSFVIFRNGDPVAPSKNPAAEVKDFDPQIVCRRLDTWPDDPPAGKIIAVDVERGRLAVGAGPWDEPTTHIDVSYHYGFSADLGGGWYERGKWLMRPDLATLRYWVKEDNVVPDGAPQVTHNSLTAALNDWAIAGRPNTIITILDNRTYAESITIEPADGHWLVIEAANQARPHLQLSDPLEIKGNHPTATVTLNGLLVEGWVHVSGSLRRFRLIHTTLVPGRALTEGFPATTEPSLVVEGGSEPALLNAQLRVEIAFSITGPLRIPAHAEGLWVLDSILDGVALPPEVARTSAIEGPGGLPGPPTWLERVTVFGPSQVKKLTLASEVNFTEPVVATQRQEGCVRFSFVPHESKTPRRYRCQPDLEIAAQIEQAEKVAQTNNTTLAPAEKDAIRAEIRGWLVPSFTSTQYGQPAYTQLHLACPPQIQTGAEDGSEMGAFCHLKQPQRETNLRLRLEEYLPFGLDPGIIYVT
jgi:hypothetical protein